MEPLEREVTVLNKLGLHARPAAEFVRAARSFKARVTFVKGGELFSATSILEVLSANLDCGATFVLMADGDDAAAAIERLANLLYEFKLQED